MEEEYSLKEALSIVEDGRTMKMRYPDENHGKKPWTEEIYKKAEKVLKKKGFSQKVLDEINKPW